MDYLVLGLDYGCLHGRGVPCVTCYERKERRKEGRKAGAFAVEWLLYHVTATGEPWFIECFYM